MNSHLVLNNYLVLFETHYRVTTVVHSGAGAQAVSFAAATEQIAFRSARAAASVMAEALGKDADVVIKSITLAGACHE